MLTRLLKDFFNNNSAENQYKIRKKAIASYVSSVVL